MEGRIVRIISNLYTVQANKKAYQCHARGRFRNDKITPLVGDLVTFDDKNNYIMEIHPRKNELERPSVSNVDQVMIMISVKNPEFSTLMLDKFITIIEYNDIKPIICFTKLDLMDKKEYQTLRPYIRYYQKLGYKVLANSQLFTLKRLLRNKITVFTGQSGVGKSTLLNKLKKDLDIPTGEISKALKRGKHTTRHVELYPMYKGLVCDTPGFSSLDLDKIKKEDIRDNFIEFKTDKCEYQDCMHIKETGCYIKQQVTDGKIINSRYENYKKLLEK